MYNELCTKSYQEAEMMPEVEQLCKFTTWFKAQIYSRQSQTWCGPTLLELVRSDVFGPSTRKALFSGCSGRKAWEKQPKAKKPAIIWRVVQETSLSAAVWYIINTLVWSTESALAVASLAIGQVGESSKVLATWVDTLANPLGKPEKTKKT